MNQKISWQQPNKEEEIFLGMVGEKTFFVIERKGYKFNCSSTPQALIGIYEEWDKDLDRLKQKASIVLEHVGVVNHVLN